MAKTRQELSATLQITIQVDSRFIHQAKKWGEKLKFTYARDKEYAALMSAYLMHLAHGGQPEQWIGSAARDIDVQEEELTGQYDEDTMEIIFGQ